jgi:hypothetical protein
LIKFFLISWDQTFPHFSERRSSGSWTTTTGNAGGSVGGVLIKSPIVRLMIMACAGGCRCRAIGSGPHFLHTWRLPCVCGRETTALRGRDLRRLDPQGRSHGEVVTRALHQQDMRRVHIGCPKLLKVGVEERCGGESLRWQWLLIKISGHCELSSSSLRRNRIIIIRGVY